MAVGDIGATRLMLPPDFYPTDTVDRYKRTLKRSKDSLNSKSPLS
jgi:rRNA maturation protein Nop10